MLLEKLVKAFGVPGFEDEIRSIVKEHMEKYLDEVQIDTLGNVIGIKRGGKRKVLLAAHMDQIGFMVRGITEDGYLVISPMGGINPVTLRSRVIRIKGKNEYVYGVIGEKPPHIEKKSEKKEIKDLRVDIGAENGEEARKIVSIGDVGSFIPNYYEIGNRVIATALDDRAGVYTLLKVMEDVESDATIYFVASVQEEIGLRGAKVSGFKVEPDIGIAIDVTHARMPGMSKGEEPIELGKGPTIGVGPTAHPKLVRHFIESAGDIPYQIEPNPSRSGTDADVIQLTREGVATAVISIPLRYMHSSVEVLDKRDLDNTIKLIKSGLKNIAKVDLHL
ncbi:peptidase M42 [Euryarchaeota archaeon ex4484_178]|nr:MAG: peptidase M42 [Euryarchaeota archaeon ex4484_178]